jgi:serine/threonine-protein kinase
MALARGTHLGAYEILGPLGAGGMGQVYRARDTRLDRQVAVKVLAEHLTNSPSALARFELEAKAVAALSHPNILAIHDFGVEAGVPYAVVELLDGQTLREHMAGPLPVRRTLEIGAALADGLAAAHAKGIVHRDLKPENVFLTRDGHVKILDFGLARTEASPLASASEAPTATDHGRAIVGTPGYMSPEQVRGLVADARSDIFSLGCVLYELLAGRRAFDGRSPAEVMSAILRDDPAPLAPHDVPAELERVVAHCLEKLPEQRFQSARDLAFDLRALQQTARATIEPSGDAPLDSLAVLPFDNLGPDSSTEYLSDGIAESVLFALSKLGSLRVMARSTVFRYKDQPLDPRRIGRELDVRAVLTGRVVQRGDALSVQAELVEVANGWLLWGERYERRLADALAIQEEIAGEISRQLRLTLSGDERAHLARRPTQDSAAYQLYLKGRYHWNKRTAEAIRRSIELFRQATDLDPTYALAWAGLADAFTLLERYGVAPPDEAMPRARAAALRAIESDDRLAEVHTSLGIIRTYYDWDWAGAESCFRRALELRPGYATAHHWFAWFLSAMARHEEALVHIRTARKLDPLSSIINTNVGSLLYFARRHEEALGETAKVVADEPAFAVAHQWRGRVLEALGRFDEALAAHRAALGLLGEDPESYANLAHACARAGRADEARSLLDELQGLSRRRYVSPYWIAMVHLGLGERDAALAWLQRAVEARFDWVTDLAVEPAFDPLRSDARFQALLGTIGLAAGGASEPAG